MPADILISGEAFNQAVALINQNQEDAGCRILLDQIRQAGAKDSGLPEVAAFLWSKGFRDEAIRSLFHGHTVDGTDVQIMKHLSGALYVEKRWVELIPIGETLSGLQPDVSHWYTVLSRAYFNTGQADRCRQTISQGLEKGKNGVEFQVGSPLQLDGPARTQVMLSRRSEASGLISGLQALYERTTIVTWEADRVSDDGARLNGASVNLAGGAAFEVTRLADTEMAPRRMEAEAVAGQDPVTVWSAEIDGLEPGTAYRVRLTAAEAEVAPITFTTLKETAAEIGCMDAVWAGDTGAVLAGTIGGTTLPTRYHFVYGDSQDQLENRTPEKWVPPGRTLRVHQEAVDAMEEWSLYAVEREIVGDDGDPDSPNAFAVRLIGPFGKDRNHLNGIGVGDLFFGWFARWFTDWESDNTGRAYCCDLRDAEAELVLRPRGLDAKDFLLAGVVQSVTGEQSAEDIKDSATWSLTAQTVDTRALDDEGWNRLRFTYPSSPRAWTFCGNNPVEQSKAARYSYLPIGNVLATHKGNIVFWFVLGDWRTPPEGDLDLRAMGLRWRDWSVLSPAMGARLTAFPEDSLSDPLSLTNGWFDNPDEMWFSAPSPTGPQTFEWSFDEDVAPTAVKLHQNPPKPACAVQILTSADGETFEEEWSGELPPAKTVVEPPKPFIINLRGRSIRHLRLVIESGYQADFWGLDGVEVFDDDARPAPELEPASICEEISDLEPGRKIYFQLVAENAAGTTEGPIHEIVIPGTRAPAIVDGCCAAQTNSRARLFLDVRPGGLETTLTGAVTDPDGETWPGREQTVGENAAVRHALFLVDCPLKEGTYRAEITASNEAGESDPFTIEWENA